jgi:acetyl esterase/lipase
MNRQTFTFATHKIPLECDVYSSSLDSFSSSSTSPVFLFFHAGGLVGWARDCVPPWLVQVCVQRKWLLISASYRFLPQVGAEGLLEDVAAAYEFARALGQKDGEGKGEGGKGNRRPVIVGGASAGMQNSKIPISFPH